MIMNLFKEFSFINVSLIEKCSEDILNVVKLNVNEEKEEENECENQTILLWKFLIRIIMKK